MKLLKQTSFLIVMLILMASFSQCSTAQKLQKEAPTQFGDVYCQKWTAGIQGGGSGINLFIPIADKSIQLDSAYFRGKSVKLEVKETKEGVIYIGRFKTEFNEPKEIIISSDPKQEYANKLPVKQEEIPFELKDDECVVSYIQEDKPMYYKISNVRQQEPLNYPMAPSNNTIKLNKTN
jgi:hypothetical protein